MTSDSAISWRNWEATKLYLVQWFEEVLHHRNALIKYCLLLQPKSNVASKYGALFTNNGNKLEKN